MTAGADLLGTPPTHLPDDPAAAALEGSDARTVATAYPSSSLVWAVLAERALDEGDDVGAYAFARTGYHRGLDSLRAHGWKGHGAVPYAHEPNRGFLRALAALGQAAAQIGESDEATRIEKFLNDSDPEAAAQIQAR